ncbi:MAG: UDP-N-acetylmuramoyl-L-alanine--D-glutamate ligase [Actinomycetota bacterium]
MTDGAGRPAAEVEALSSWYAEWSGLRAVVLGLGLSGFAAADTLVELGAEVLVLADRADPERGDLLAVIGAAFEPGDTGSGAAARIADFGAEVLVVSPGVPPSHPAVIAAVTAGTPVWGEVELAWRVRDKTGTPADWICVTGTNGKTTTVKLATAMIAASGRRVLACGNVGVPVLDAVRDPGGFDVLVVELSSFQLHYSHSVSPLSSVCLNVADDHLDWHGSAEAYRAAKARVYTGTRVACLFNRDDAATRSMVEQAEVVDGCRAVGFGLGVPGPSDLGLVDELLCDRAFLDARFTTALELATRDDLSRAGLATPHLVANVLAAAGLARSIGVQPADIRAAVRAFRTDPHRTETVATADGVSWVDDSKATNPHAAAASLGAFERVVWIVGGLLKGVELDGIIVGHLPALRAAVVIGVDRVDVLAAFERHAPGLPVLEVDTLDTENVMPTAVRLSATVAQTGDVVLLAPAAASMDQFLDYADRGRRFSEAVHDMLGGRPDDDQHPAAPPGP